ncbi:hypothetical protein GCM10025866_23310 [Naasia aerilata]|uniref:Uncharacterized protein n=1 Tax=Naasia aerilata TaxID=1162966 RepID=A0ABN6XN44_9MICO|nr:hypothetical protein GCM10025866_23310 [Naasia aerilata]
MLEEAARRATGDRRAGEDEAGEREHGEGGEEHEPGDRDHDDRVGADRRAEGGEEESQSRGHASLFRVRPVVG